MKIINNFKLNQNMKNSISLLFIIILIFLILLYLIIGKKENKKIKSIVNNFIILLDLSDRLNKQNQIEKDKEIIKGIFDIFEKQVKNKQYIGSKDIIKILVAPQPRIGYSHLNIYRNLEINMGNFNPTEKSKVYDEHKILFFNSLDTLYNIASQNSDYIGADIWGFFNSSLEQNVINKEEYRNILFIITDGYLNFNRNYEMSRRTEDNKKTFTDIKRFRNNSNWENDFNNGNYGLIPIKKIWGNLEVYILELNPFDEIRNTTELDIIKKYWETWFNEMDINKYKCFKTEDATNQVINSLKSIVNENNNK